MPVLSCPSLPLPVLYCHCPVMSCPVHVLFCRLHCPCFFLTLSWHCFAPVGLVLSCDSVPCPSLSFSSPMSCPCHCLGPVLLCSMPFPVPLPPLACPCICLSLPALALPSPSLSWHCVVRCFPCSRHVIACPCLACPALRCPCLACPCPACPSLAIPIMSCSYRLLVLVRTCSLTLGLALACVALPSLPLSLFM